MSAWLFLAALLAVGVAAVVLGAALARTDTGPVPPAERDVDGWLLAAHHVTDGRCGR